MTDYTAWLGPAAEEMTPEQRSRFDEEATLLDVTYLVDEDGDQADWDAAASATVEWILGPACASAVDMVGRQLLHLRLAERRAYVTAVQTARLAALDGMAEAEAARLAQIDRMTLRKALGKR